MNAKEQFTDDVMRSLDGAGRATLDRNVREGILIGMQDAGCRMQDAGYRMQDTGCRMQDTGCRMQDTGYQMADSGWQIKTSMVWKIAAVILLLVSLNVFTMTYFNKSTTNQAKSTNPVASEYFSYLNTINL